jgi:hypothetical protein
VLPNNAYEREGSPATVDAAEPSGPEAIDFGQRGEPPLRQSAPDAQPHRSGDGDSGSGTRKRVRFAAYVPPQQRSAEGAGPAQVCMLAITTLTADFRCRHAPESLAAAPVAGSALRKSVFLCNRVLNITHS